MNTHSVVTFTQHSRDTGAVWAWEGGRVINSVVSWASHWGEGPLPHPGGPGCPLIYKPLISRNNKALSYLTTSAPSVSWGPSQDSPWLPSLSRSSAPLLGF